MCHTNKYGFDIRIVVVVVAAAAAVVVVVVVLLLLSLLSRVSMAMVAASLLRLFFPRLNFLSLLSPSPNSLQLHLSVAVVLHSLPTLSRSLLAHSRFSSPHCFPSTFCSLCQLFISDSFHMSCPFQPTPHQFLFKRFRHSNLHF